MEDKLKQDLKQAQLRRDEIRTSTLRLLLSEINNLKIQKGVDYQVTDTDIVPVVQKEVKKRREAAEGFRKGGRETSAQKEEAELKILEGYLPAQLTNEELTKLVDMAINEVGANSMQDMGRVIGAVMDKVGQGADGARVSALVRDKLLQ